MESKWWENAVGYQLYPRSFQDTNYDGIGDIQGIRKRLSYLKELGVDFLWINPMYQSPNIDNGYDISDFYKLNPEFGDLDEFIELVDAAHQMGIKVLVDLVVNHTSDQHPWFLESKKSKDNPYREYYHWAEATPEKMPNNWQSFFGGSTWTYDEHTEQAYFHVFAKEQPDLNWTNPKVREEIYQMIRWWLELGVDGFRLDAISHIQKESWDFKITSNPWAPFMNVSGIENYMAELSTIFREYQVMTVGEASGVTSHEAVKWTGNHGFLDMIFELEHNVKIGNSGEEKTSIVGFKKVMQRWQMDLLKGGWQALYIENHDLPRSITTMGNGTIESAKAIAIAYFLMRGTPFIYQGQEIGMANYPFRTIEEVDGEDTKYFYYSLLNQGISEKKALKLALNWSRDHSRTPMQWSADCQAGFSEVASWLPVHPNYRQVNVENEKNRQGSLLLFYQELISLRKKIVEFTKGSITFYLKKHPYVICYTREFQRLGALVVVNLSEKKQKVDLPKWIISNQKTILLKNYTEEKVFTSRIELLPYEAAVIRYVNPKK